MLYSISQVAKASGVSARMLRHYDAMGLLSPAEVAGNGYRWYGRGELLRLQRIIALRDTGMGLKEIRRVLEDQSDEATALQSQLTELHRERDRIEEAIATVTATIADLDKAKIEDPEEFFRGLRRDRQSLQAVLENDVGPEVSTVFHDAQTATAAFSSEDYEHEAAQSRALFRRLAEIMNRGTASDAPAAQQAVAEHYATISRFWQPTPDAYRALGRLYLDDPMQRAMAMEADPQLPEWLASAISAYADTLSNGPSTLARPGQQRMGTARER